MVRPDFAMTNLEERKEKILAAQAAEVMPEENYAYTTFVTSQYQTIALPAPQTIWHYTSGSSLISIIQSGQLWSTQLSCVNDQTELIYAIELFREAIEEYVAGGGLSSDDEYLYEMIKSRLSGDNAASEWFITCFSDSPDDLSQWRAYGGGEGGYAIGFRSKELGINGSRDQAYLVNVNYDLDTHRRIANAVAEATFTFYRQGLLQGRRHRDAWAGAFLLRWGEVITFLAPVVKHKAFQAEREWRVVRRLREGDAKKLVFTQKQSLMARHLPLTFDAEGAQPPRLPIDAVLVGPARNGRVSKISVGDLLLGRDYNDVPVELSKAPFQAV
jgi:hypothetical protein